MLWASVLGVLILILVMAACAGSDEPDLPGTTSSSLLGYLEGVDYQNNDDWKLFPGSTEKYAGTDPHGMLLTTYVNPAAFEAIEAGETSPSGSIIVKENYTPEGVLAATTTMYKSEGYNPDHNDWYWIKVLADGTVEKEGQVMGCQDCHVDARDYIWGPQPES
jgi:hypothetical protein